MSLVSGGLSPVSGGLPLLHCFMQPAGQMSEFRMAYYVTATGLYTEWTCVWRPREAAEKCLREMGFGRAIIQAFLDEESEIFEGERLFPCDSGAVVEHHYPMSRTEEVWMVPRR